MSSWIVRLSAAVAIIFSSLVFAADGLKSIAPREDGPYEGFAEYAVKLKGNGYFYSGCRGERGPAYLVVPTRPDINIALIELSHRGAQKSATVINNAVLRNRRGEIEVVETEGGIGSIISVHTIANFLKGQTFYFVATGEMDELRLPEVVCPQGT